MLDKIAENFQEFSGESIEDDKINFDDTQEIVDSYIDAVDTDLDKNKITYTGLEYGRYTQEEFRESISEVKYCIIIDNTESQGIAIQEMMAYNKPLLVWNQTVWNHLGDDYIVEGTSIPYWSSECGETFVDYENFDKVFNLFLSKLDKYNPKKYVDRELSPQKSIDTLLKLF